MCSLLYNAKLTIRCIVGQCDINLHLNTDVSQYNGNVGVTDKIITVANTLVHEFEINFRLVQN